MSNHRIFFTKFNSNIINTADEKTHDFNRVDDSPQIF